MTRVRVVRCLLVCACVAACGGKSPTAPTAAAPQITCPTDPAPVESLDGSAQPVSFPAPTVTGGQAPVTTTCSPASGSGFPVGTTPVGCTVTDAKSRSATCSFNVAVLAPPKLPTNQFLAFGDSLTWGEDGTDALATRTEGRQIFVQFPAAQTYPGALEQELQARYVLQPPVVTNAGCPGEYASDPGTTARFGALMRSGQWGSVLIMEGSNDVDSEDSVVTRDAMANLQAMVEYAKAHGVIPLLATIPPMVPPGFNQRAKGAADVPAYDDQVRALASSENVALADVYNAFGSDAPSLIGFDGLHPNAAGYQKIADTFFASIKGSLETRSLLFVKPQAATIQVINAECAGS